jgi:hypothetical protein
MCKITPVVLLFEKKKMKIILVSKTNFKICFLKEKKLHTGRRTLEV